MRYSHAVGVALSPLVGFAVAAFLIAFMDRDAINPQGGGRPTNAAGVSALLWGLHGWWVTLPLAAVLASVVRRRQLKRKSAGADPAAGLVAGTARAPGSAGR